MKYVGATNAMVTLPFFMEGLTMGLDLRCHHLGSGHRRLLLYRGSIQRLRQPVGDAHGRSPLVPVENVWPTILTYSLAGGALVGALGSTFSIRKHLNV